MSSVNIYNRKTKECKEVANKKKVAILDSVMSDESTNAVQNKVVKKYVDNCIEKINKLTKEISAHKCESINSEEGAHKLREFEGKLEYYDGKKWIEIKTGGSSIGVGDVIGASITSSSRQVTLKWTDPNDIEVSGAPIATWAGTKLIRKEGSSPESISDGVVVVDNTIKNKYSSEGYTDSGLENGVTYYYRFFTYTTENVVTAGTSLNVTPGRIAIATLPSQSGTLTYDGISKTPLWNNYDTNKMTIGGTTSATNAGTYTATFTPTEDYCWSDGSVAEKNVTWIIEKTSGSVTLSSSSVILDESNKSKTVTVSDATGEITVSSDDTSVATASISGTTITISSVNDSNGTATITVNVASSINYNATNKTISVTAEFTPDGATVTPINDVTTLVKCAGVSSSSSYMTIADVLGNDDTMSAITMDENAMKYLARSTGFADDLCADETFMTFLGQSPYVDDTVLNSDIWVEKICDSIYFESVLNVSVPTMTSNTTPSGEVSGSSLSVGELWYAFDKNNSTYAEYSNLFIVYDFKIGVCSKLFEITHTIGGDRMSSFELFASNDGNNYTSLGVFNIPTSNGKYVYKLDNPNYYRYYKFLPKTHGSSQAPYIVTEIQFYGRKSNN